MKRRRFFLMVLSLLLVLAPGVCSLAHGAGTGGPDLSGLRGKFVLQENRRLLLHPDGDMLLVSGSETASVAACMVSLDGAGKAQWYARLNMRYSEAAVSGRALILAGISPGSGFAALGRVDLETHEQSVFSLSDTACAPERGFYADDSGNVHLVTAPIGEEIDDDTPVSVYCLSENGEWNRVGSHPQGDGPTPPPESSEAPDPSAPDSSEPTSSTKPPESSNPPESSETPEPPGPVFTSYYNFARGTTVFDLERQFLSEERPGTVRVTKPDGTYVTSGRIGTGYLVEVVTSLGVETRVAAVIPGDLTGSGAVSAAPLYGYLTGQNDLLGAYFEAADLNGDGLLTTADLLELRRLS